MIIYFITTIVSMSMSSFVVKYDYIKSDLKNYLWVLYIFTILLILIRVFRVKIKSVLIILGIIMFLLLFVLINVDIFISRWSTPDPMILPKMSSIALYTTLPFQSLINALVGYDIGYLSCIIVPIYMGILSILSYLTLKLK